MFKNIENKNLVNSVSYRLNVYLFSFISVKKHKKTFPSVSVIEKKGKKKFLTEKYNII